MGLLDSIINRHRITSEVIKRYVRAFNGDFLRVLKDGIRPNYTIYKTRKCVVIRIELSEQGNGNIGILEHQDFQQVFNDLLINDFLPYLNNDIVNIIIKGNNQIIIIKDFNNKVWNIRCAKNDVFTIIGGGL